MDLHPCDCGDDQPASTTVRPYEALSDGDTELYRFRGACPECEFLFRVPDEPLPPDPEGVFRVVFGGMEPSQLLDPGEWMGVSDVFRRLWPDDVDEIAPDDRFQARA